MRARVRVCACVYLLYLYVYMCVYVHVDVLRIFIHVYAYFCVQCSRCTLHTQPTIIYYTTTLAAVHVCVFVGHRRTNHSDILQLTFWRDQ